VDLRRRNAVEQHDAFDEPRVDLAVSQDAIDRAAGDRGRGVEIDPVVLREIGIECQAEEACFALCEDTVEGQCKLRRRGGQIEDSYPPRALGYEQPAIGSERHRPRDFEGLDDGLDSEADAVLRREYLPDRRRGGGRRRWNWTRCRSGGIRAAAARLGYLRGQNERQ
jgi:hypothetical protein